MFKDAFTKLDALEIETLLPALNPLIEGSPYQAGSTAILALALDFYPGCSLLEMADQSTLPPRKTSVIYKPGLDKPSLQRSSPEGSGLAVVLDWSNAPIYRLNEVVPIRLDERNIIDYARFFFTYVRGRHGRFLITESVDDIAWKNDPPPAARKAIGGLIEPLKLLAIDADGSFVLTARMMFKDSLFKSDIRIGAKGLVTMENEELVVEDIPVRGDVIG